MSQDFQQLAVLRRERIERAKAGTETMADIVADLRDPYMGRETMEAMDGESVRVALRRLADRIEAVNRRSPPAIAGRGYRRLLVSWHLLELILTEGTGSTEAINVPTDLAIHGMRFGNALPNLIPDGVAELLVSSEKWATDGEGWDSAIFFVEFRAKQLWFVARVPADSEFEFQGLFDSEARAIAACRDETYWIQPVDLNVLLPHETTPWPYGTYYPKLETKEEAAARLKVGREG